MWSGRGKAVKNVNESVDIKTGVIFSIFVHLTNYTPTRRKKKKKEERRKRKKKKKEERIF